MPTLRSYDWIETNLLKVDTGKIRRVVFDNYKLQEARDARRGKDVGVRLHGALGKRGIGGMADSAPQPAAAWRSLAGPPGGDEIGSECHRLQGDQARFGPAAEPHLGVRGGPGTG